VPVQHSIRAPAVGYRISCGKSVVFYVPDVLSIPDSDRAFANVDLYVGDGASLRRPIQRQHDGTRVGHASVATQIEWCAAAGIRRAIFTHCGTGAVTHERKTELAVIALGEGLRIDAHVAIDGLKVSLR
jgi:phosphoribosyl 1,2-cyclic phosphodiesterase